MATSWSRPLREGTPSACHMLNVKRYLSRVTRYTARVTCSASTRQHPEERLRRRQSVRGMRLSVRVHVQRVRVHAKVLQHYTERCMLRLH